MKNKALFNVYSYSFLSGILFALGFPNIIGEGLSVIPSILGIAIILFAQLEAKGWKQSTLSILIYSFSANLMAYSWIPQTLAEFGNLPLVLGGILWFLFTLIILPNWWVLLLLYWSIKKHSPQFELAHIWQRDIYKVIFAFIFALCEYLTPAQFPSYLASPWVIWGKYLGLAPIGGIPLFSFMSFLLAIEIAGFLAKKKISKLQIMFFVLFIILNPLLVKKMPLQSELGLRIVQANISNYLKIESEGGSYPSTQKVIDTYRDLSKQPFKEGKIDLIVWPETAYPYSVDTTNSKAIGFFADIIDEMQTELFIGSYESNPNAKGGYQGEFNTSFLYGEDKNLKATYHKQILIPFGETLPLGPLTELASRYIDTIAFFGVGEKYTLFHLKNNLKAISAICYEVLKPEFIRSYLNQLDTTPELLINLTNDSWYGDTAEPHQHLFLTKWRALEHQLTIIRSTNTGITSVIYPDGSESKRLSIGERGNLDLRIPVLQSYSTPFQKWGLLCLVPIFFLYFILELVLVKYRRAEN